MFTLGKVLGGTFITFFLLTFICCGSESTTALPPDIIPSSTVTEDSPSTFLPVVSPVPDTFPVAPPATTIPDQETEPIVVEPPVSPPPVVPPLPDPDSTIVYELGDIARTISFPAGISGVSDIVFDNTSQSLMIFAYDILKSWEVTQIIQIDALSGSVLSVIQISNPDFFMNHASSFTKVADNYYGTSYGYNNGVPVSLIYIIDLSGNIVANFPCPATNTGGFCVGIAWDGQNLWSGASDNKNIAQFSLNGDVLVTLAAFDSTGSRVEGYDATAKQLIVSMDNHLRRIDPVTGAEISNFYTGYSRKGDITGRFFWAINSGAQQLEKIYIGD